MDIGNNGFNPGGGDDLLQRMERAHAREVEAAGSVDGAASSAASGSLEGVDRSDAASGAGSPELEKQLLTTASDALDGDFSGPDEVRAAVVETIVDTRYGDGLAKSERDQIVTTLEQTLVDDPEFRAEVDNMLILAARELARKS